VSSKLPVAAIGAWLLVAVYYFYQYALRSAPSVMIPELTGAFGVNALGVSAMVGMFYYGYSPFSLVAGTSMDRFGAKRVIPISLPSSARGAVQCRFGFIRDERWRHPSGRAWFRLFPNCGNANCGDRSSRVFRTSQTSRLNVMSFYS
jgi:hypothetical protein